MTNGTATFGWMVSGALALALVAMGWLWPIDARPASVDEPGSAVGDAAVSSLPTSVRERAMRLIDGVPDVPPSKNSSNASADPVQPPVAPTLLALSTDQHGKLAVLRLADGAVWCARAGDNRSDLTVVSINGNSVEMVVAGSSVVVRLETEASR